MQLFDEFGNPRVFRPAVVIEDAIPQETVEQKEADNLKYLQVLVHRQDLAIHSLMREVQYLKQGEALNSARQSATHHRRRSKVLIARIRELQREPTNR